MGLARKLLGAPTVGDTLETVTLGNCDDVDTVVLFEDRGDFDWLLKEAICKVDFVGDRTTVDLDLHKVCLLLAETGLADLGVCEDTDDGAVFANTLEFACGRLSAVFCVLLGIASEGFLLRTVPVFVEATFECV